jgi:hypothetical protein
MYVLYTVPTTVPVRYGIMDNGGTEEILLNHIIPKTLSGIALLSAVQ